MYASGTTERAASVSVGPGAMAFTRMFIAPELVGQLLGERVDARLGPAVVAGVEVGGRGGLVDDGAAAARRHRRVAGPGAHQRAEQVHLEEALQIRPSPR